jgi:hypothetical protein
LIALDVQLPVYVVGRWNLREFSESLCLELAKYNIKVVGREPAPDDVALIDLGRWTYWDWQEIRVALVHADTTTPLGQVRIPGLSARAANGAPAPTAVQSTTTLDAAAVPVAELIARKIWARPPEP